MNEAVAHSFHMEPVSMFREDAVNEHVEANAACSVVVVVLSRLLRPIPQL